MRIRWGRTAGEETGWQSDSSVTCRVGDRRAEGHSTSVAVTAGMRAGSMSEAGSYDAVLISGRELSNTAGSQALSLTVAGSLMGYAPMSLILRQGGSACVSTMWMSDSAVACSVAAGGGGSRGIVITAVLQSGTMSQVGSYDGGDVSSVLGHNGGSRSQTASVTLMAQGFGRTSASVSASNGWTGCEASVWASWSGVVCKTPGRRVGRGSESVVVTAGVRRAGSLTEVMSFQTPIVSSVEASTANGNGGMYGSVTISGYGLGHGDGSVGVRVGGSGAEASEWSSDSSLACKIAFGRGGSLRVSVTLGGQGGSRSSSLSYDGEGDVDRWLTPGAVQNIVSGGAGDVMLRESASMGLVASATGRIGATQCEASMWASTSELQCKAPRGVRGSQTLAVTAGMRARSLTTTMTFDVNRVSASTGGNAATTGAVFLTIAGSGYGTSAGTPGSRAGKSSCESTKWVAESSMVCRQASGVAGSRSIQVSMGETVGSVTEVRSYDMERVSATGRSNGPGGVGGAAGALTRRSVVVSGGGMGHTATSGRAQVGASSCEASIWQSESAVVCYAGVGLGGSRVVVVTSGMGGGGQGSLSVGWSYDLASLSGQRGSSMNVAAGGSTAGAVQATVWVGVLARGYGVQEMSGRVGGGGSGAEASRWQSDSMVECRWSMGAGGTFGVVVTASGMASSVSQGLSYSGPGIGGGGETGVVNLQTRGGGWG